MAVNDRRFRPVEGRRKRKIWRYGFSLHSGKINRYRHTLLHYASAWPVHRDRDSESGSASSVGSEKLARRVLENLRDALILLAPSGQ